MAGTRQKHFRFQPHRHNPFERYNRNVEKPSCLLQQETLRLRKAVPRLSKKKPALQCCAGKAVITSAIARGITLNPVVFASFTGFGLVVKAVASFKKYDKKPRKPTSRESSTRKSLMRFGFISEASLLMKKTSLAS